MEFVEQLYAEATQRAGSPEEMTRLVRDVMDEFVASRTTCPLYFLLERVPGGWKSKLMEDMWPEEYDKEDSFDRMWVPAWNF